MRERLRPPAKAVQILDLYSSDPALAHIAGDMEEEFHQRCRENGTGPARRWYWGQLFRNLGILTARQIAVRLTAWHARMQGSRGPHSLGILGAFLCLMMIRLPSLLYGVRPASPPSAAPMLIGFALPFLCAIVLGVAFARLEEDENGEMRRAYVAAGLFLLLPAILAILRSGRLPALWPLPQWLQYAGVMVFFRLGVRCQAAVCHRFYG